MHFTDCCAAAYSIVTKLCDNSNTFEHRFAHPLSPCSAENPQQCGHNATFAALQALWCTLVLHESNTIK
jgi:hypothetical protein